MTKKDIIKFITFPLLLVVVVFLVSHFLFVSRNLMSYGKFYEERKDSIDVVLIGNSTVMNGFIPPLAWKEFGYTSYSICNAPTHPEVIKIAIDEIMRTQSPKVIYVDINGLTYQKKIDAENFVRSYIGSMPDCDAKKELELLYGISNEGDSGLFKGHNNFRQKEFWRLSLDKGPSWNKGYTPKRTAQIITPMDTISGYSLPLPQDGQEYLTEILDICDKYTDVDFVFGKTPRFLTDENAYATYMLRSVQPIIEACGYRFIDFYEILDEIGLENTRDMFDLEHMNHSGATKFTRYFSEFIKLEYGIGDMNYSNDIKRNYNNAYERFRKEVYKYEKALGM